MVLLTIFVFNDIDIDLLSHDTFVRDRMHLLQDLWVLHQLLLEVSCQILEFTVFLEGNIEGPDVLLDHLRLLIKLLLDIPLKIWSLSLDQEVLQEPVRRSINVILNAFE